MNRTLTLEADPAFIQALGQVQNEFLQVLLSEFFLSQGDGGIVLEVEFSYETPAVWLRRGKSYIHRQLNPATIIQYQKELEQILLGHKRLKWIHNNPAFPFRFGNGGTLPVIRTGDKDYYCLFYRELDPIGWNIANGGAESTAELLDPISIIERELREELIIVEPASGHRYIFDWNEGRRADHPDFAIARRVWQEIFQKRNFLQLEELALPLKWMSGNDSIVIRFNNQAPIVIKDCLLNINAEDFGIEIDRIAKIAIGRDAILCDGEIVRGSLLNRVIGLFDVHRFNAAMAGGKSEFFPDRVFYDGKERLGEDFNKVVSEYMADILDRGVWASDVRHQWESAKIKFGLCPVTRNLIRRFLLLEHENQSLIVPPQFPPSLTSKSNPDVFLSFASEDTALAQQVFSFLQDSGHKVFFSHETLHQANFGDAIDDALKSAKSMVVVGSETNHFFKPWVRYEWQSFHNDINAGFKKWETPLVTFAVKPDLERMPRPLVFREVVDCDPASLDPSLQKLNRILG